MKEKEKRWAWFCTFCILTLNLRGIKRFKTVRNNSVFCQAAPLLTARRHGGGSAAQTLIRTRDGSVLSGYASADRRWASLWSGLTESQLRTGDQRAQTRTVRGGRRSHAVGNVASKGHFFQVCCKCHLITFFLNLHQLMTVSQEHRDFRIYTSLNSNFLFSCLSFLVSTFLCSLFIQQRI